jgi:hypothetical protein
MNYIDANTGKETKLIEFHIDLNRRDGMKLRYSAEQDIETGFIDFLGATYMGWASWKEKGDI